MATIAGLSGNQFLPSSKDYSERQYQYATSTHAIDHDMHPGLIVQPHNKDDIKKVIAYAKTHGKAIAIRTGGHQYSGASSTGPNNVQLDLRSTFRSPGDLVYVEEVTHSFVRASVSHSIGELSDYLSKHQVFVPLGQCSHVYLGGHAQTGGYGQLGRNFGLFGDYIRTLEIIDHNGEEKEITRTSDPELFYAWLGGSPGNFGVLTHVLLEVNRDSDYVGSLGLRVVHLYDTAKLRKLGLDEQMKEEHPETVAHEGNPVWPRRIVVYAQYIPFSPSDKPDMNFFEQLETGSFLQSEVEKMPMSQLSSLWMFRDMREFELPYVKRMYATKSRTLVKDGWVDWVVSRVDEIVEPSLNGQWLTAQFQCFGGKNSMFTRNANNGTSYSWRDSTMLMTMDNFHKPEKKAEAEAWEAKNDAEAIGPQGIFSKEDRRLVWGSYGSFDLDSVWETYYEDRPKYERLMRARKRADPNGTFTPNSFCVKRAE
ncbi:FAD-binding PCMH-type domain-containing protein [Favolaschia claudopus]|uniref:FAD-binding PCMH-type domain-containing protein n=1 Tax=Favolaschia claudopus TaxID=2862362 RepID=A0AAW0A2T5_9AGAR